MSDFIPFKLEDKDGNELLFVDANNGVVYLGGRTNGLKIEAGGIVSVVGSGSLPTGEAQIPQFVLDDIASKVDKITGYSLVADTEISKIHSSGSDNQDLSGLEPADPAIQSHIISPHAPAGAQVNADITKSEIEAKLTGPISTHSHTGGADPFMAKLVVNGDKATGANTTPVTLGISFNYEANSTYVIDIYAMVAPSAATVGCGFLLDTDTAVNYVGTFTVHQLANTGTLSGSSSIGDRGATQMGVSSGMPSTQNNFVTGSMLLITGANAGIATPYFRSETTGVTTCKSGSVFRIMKI